MRRTASSAQPSEEAYGRGIDLFRPLAVGYAAVLAWQRHADMVRPGAAGLILAVLLCWSLLMLRYRWRTTAAAVLELALGCAAILATGLVDSRAVIESGAPTIPGLFPVAAVTALAVLHGVRGGLLGAVAVAAADLLLVLHPTATSIHNIVLLLALGGFLGLAAELARDGEASLREALAIEERTQERERLARAVHDGVLQSLALMHRRGRDPQATAAELGEMAAAAERSLRSVVNRDGVRERTGTNEDRVDLMQVLSDLERDGVQLSGPARAVLMPASRAAELAAAVAACLDNVQAHAGPGAQAWVLVEDGVGEVLVTVRDNGVGCEPERLRRAAEEGRMGVTGSIKGRLAHLGGSAHLTARPGKGVTVHLRTPLDPANAADLSARPQEMPR